MDAAPQLIVERASSLSAGLFLRIDCLDDAFFRVEELVEASTTSLSKRDWSPRIVDSSAVDPGIVVPSLDKYSHVRVRSSHRLQLGRCRSQRSLARAQARHDFRLDGPLISRRQRLQCLVNDDAASYSVSPAVITFIALIQAETHLL